MEQVLYELPDGWEWYNIEKVAQIGASRDFIPTPDTAGNVPFVGMTDIDQETGQNSTYQLRNFEDVKKGYTKFQRNAVLLAKITPCTENNKTALIDAIDGGYATTEVYPIHALSELNPEYLLYFFRSPSIRSFLIEQMEGATGRQRVPLKALKNVKIPVCRLSEQKRIVEKINALFTRIDTTIKHLQESIVLADALYASSLDQIFNPKSSPLNSKGTYELPNEWKWIKINDTFTMTSGQNLTKNDMQIGGEYTVYGGNGITGQHNNFNIEGVNIIIGRVGALCGNVRLVTGKIWVTDNAFFIKNYKVDISKKYLANLLGVMNLGDTANRSAQPVISYKGIKEIYIPYPPVQEQKRIVEEIDIINKYYISLKEHKQKRIMNLQKLKTSILDSAFKGKL